MISLARKELATAINVVCRVAEPKSTMPMLANVHLTTEGHHLRATCTDLYTTASAIVPFDGTDPVDHVVDVRALVDRLKRFKNGHLDVVPPANDGALLAFVEGSRRYELPCIAGENFPPRPDDRGARTLLSCDASTLARAIDAVICTVSTDTTRAHLNSVRWEVSAANLRLVATDGHRMAVHNEPLSDGASFDAVFLLSLSSVEHIRAVLGGRKPSGPVRVSFDGKRGAESDVDLGVVHVDHGAVSLAARCVDAMFPPYEQVMPALHRMDRHVTCDRAELIDALVAVSVAASARTGAVMLDFGAESIVLKAESPDNGVAVERVGGHRVCRDASGATDLRIGVNARYLLDALRAGDSQYACLSTSGVLDPIRLMASATTSHVVMPVKLT